MATRAELDGALARICSDPAVLIDGRPIAHYADPDVACGACVETSDELGAQLHEADFTGRWVDLASDMGWGGHGTVHSVVVIDLDTGPVVVDCTARQFAPDTPWPLVVDYDTYLAGHLITRAGPMRWTLYETDLFPNSGALT